MRKTVEEKEGKKTALLAIGALSVVALLVGIAGLGMSLAAPAPSRPAPVDRDIRLVIVALEPHNATQMPMMTEQHMYFPGAIVVNVGDRIRLTIVNMDEHRHGFEIMALGIETDSISDIMPGDTVTLPTFTVNQAGTYVFECNVPYVPPTPPATEHEDCGLDHISMQGYLIVQ